MNILIYGYGFVGKAVAHGFSYNSIRIIDPQHNNETVDTLKDDTEWYPDFAFFCLPTPTVDDECKGDLLENELSKFKARFPDVQVVVKSTMTPLVLDKLLRIDPDLVYNPEFLRAFNANWDFNNPDMVVLGGDRRRCERVAELYLRDSNLAKTRYIFVNHHEASLIKYAINSFLATKVAFFNDFYDIWDQSDTECDWGQFIRFLSLDKRIGDSHMQVPGSDGSRGFGGACFPKDTEALRGYGRFKGVVPEVLDAVIECNASRRA